MMVKKLGSRINVVAPLIKVRTSFSYSGFTLAEMMVVMLILTIVLAAFAPMMTKRKAVDLTSPWRYATNNNDAYFGLANTQSALIGLNNKNDNDYNAKLVIKTPNDNQPYISFRDPDVGLAANLKLEDLEGTDGTLRFGGPYSTNVSGSGNTAMGLGALRSLTSGGSNTAFGNNAMRNNSSQDYNTAIGARALRALISGDNNVAIGYNALNSATLSGANVAVGSYTMTSSEPGQQCVAIGYKALMNDRSVGYSTAVGGYALINTTTGSGNTAVGYAALENNTTGSGNVAIGERACQYVTTGSNKTCIGRDSGPANNSIDRTNDTDILYLGNANTIVHIPGRLVVDGSVALARKNGNRVWIRTDSFNGNRESLDLVRQENDTSGNRSILKAEHDNSQGEDFVPSDRRLKNVGDVFTDGLNKIRELKVYNYTYKKDETNYPRVGVMAQDLQKVFPNAVIKDNDGYLKIRRDDMFYAMLNAIKELDEKLTALVEEVKSVIARIDKHDEEIKQLKEENALLRDKNKELEKRLEKLEKLF